MIQTAENKSVNRQWIMLLCTVRYAMGSSSYVVGEAVGAVRDLWPSIRAEQRVQLRREVFEWVKSTEGKLAPLRGDWDRLAKWMHGLL